CFLYSIHYSASIERLRACISSVHAALAPGGVFCFNAVDRQRIDNASFVSHSALHAEGQFRFSSGWYYPGDGEQQALRLRIQRTPAARTETRNDDRTSVAKATRGARA